MIPILLYQLVGYCKHAEVGREKFWSRVISVAMTPQLLPVFEDEQRAQRFVAAAVIQRSWTRDQLNRIQIRFLTVLPLFSLSTLLQSAINSEHYSRLKLHKSLTWHCLCQ